MVVLGVPAAAMVMTVVSAARRSRAGSKDLRSWYEPSRHLDLHSVRVLCHRLSVHPNCS